MHALLRSFVDPQLTMSVLTKALIKTKAPIVPDAGLKSLDVIIK